MGNVYVIGTCDTKQEELAYACRLIRATGVTAILVDVGTSGKAADADISAQEVAAMHPQGTEAVFGSGDRGASVSAMAEALTEWLSTRTDIRAVLGLGGSGNTALVTATMQSLPVGVPKLMVSTVASGNTAPYVGPSDIAMMYSVTDIAGLNAISRKVIGNAAHAVAGMAMWEPPAKSGDRPGVGMTMFGVTTTCIDQIRERLGDGFESYVFHATGTGGQSMEKLADSGLITGMIDVTTTEIADLLMGGIFACTEDRLSAVARTRLPYVGSVGAVDMVNFGAKETVPEKYQARKLYVHNPQVTLMRTTAAENAAIGCWIAERLNRCEGEIRFLLPLAGVSAIDAPGMPFHDPAADEALFEAIRSILTVTPRRKLIELPLNINDPAFADAVVAEFREIAS